ADQRVSVRGVLGQPCVPVGASAAGEVQSAVTRAAQVRDAVVVDVGSPAHVGEACRVLAVGEVQRIRAGLRRNRPRRSGDSERNEACEGADALVEAKRHRHALRPAVREIGPNPAVMSAVCSPCVPPPPGRAPSTRAATFWTWPPGPVNRDRNRRRSAFPLPGSWVAAYTAATLDFSSATAAWSALRCAVNVALPRGAALPPR